MEVDWPAHMKKLEQTGQSLMKQARDLLRSGDKLVGTKPYLKGLLVGGKASMCSWLMHTWGILPHWHPFPTSTSRCMKDIVP